MKVITKVSLTTVLTVMLVLAGCGGDEAVKPAEEPTRSIVPPPPAPEPEPEPQAQADRKSVV